MQPSSRSRSLAFLASIAVLLSSFVFAVDGIAQSPTTRPRVQLGDVFYLGKFTLPFDDGAGGALTYSHPVMGMGADGSSLYVGCSSGIARVAIPALGATAAILEPCRRVPDISAVDPGDSNGYNYGGILSWLGKLVVSAYVFYDADVDAAMSHWSGTSIGGVLGPYSVGTLNAGFVAGPMTPIPAEWRALLGGPVLTGQCCLSIISRTSSGPSASVFDPAQLGATNPVPSTMLVGYPINHTNSAIGSYAVSGPLYDLASSFGGMAFPEGTRSLLFVERVGTIANRCYGTGTNNPSLHNTPIPNGGGHVYCYDPTNPYQGGHSFPYKNVIGAYDANDLLAVKQGSKQPWDVIPYAVWEINQMDNTGSATMNSSAYDPVTKRWYIRQQTDGRTPEVHVYEIRTGGSGGDSTPP
ncbi:MAG: hypothetical protein IT290_10215, partial [Deltaproteobacteria bacterium]|nr:hypothetical protein [Deltaproteobacteria bacterium]